MYARSNLDIYYSSLSEMESIRITGMTDADRERFFAAGECNIAHLEAAFDEMKQQDGKHFELPPVIPGPVKLADMYMRVGRWDDAIRVYNFCSDIPYLSDISFRMLVMECEENRQCVEAITALLADGAMQQKAIKKALAKDFTSRTLSYTLRYYSAFTRTKDGSDYIVQMNK